MDMFILCPGFCFAVLIAFLLSHKQSAKVESPLINDRLTDSIGNNLIATPTAMRICDPAVHGFNSVQSLGFHGIDLKA
jgi:hypothetical protein